MDEIDKIAYQKLYDLLVSQQKAQEKVMQHQLDALNSIKWNVRFFVIVSVISAILLLIT